MSRVIGRSRLDRAKKYLEEEKKRRRKQKAIFAPFRGLLKPRGKGKKRKRKK